MLRKRIIFALGSNVGNREAFLNDAVESLISSLDLLHIKRSNILQNKALLLPNSPAEWDMDFYNLAIAADIDLESFGAMDILNIVKRIESDLGRNDRGRWGPREIDIDILAISDLLIDLGDKLQIPHQELLNRDFFTKPFIEIEPELFRDLEKLLSKIS
ncbi:MAG: 2-amino-4-hydroxy-6-hydroxymethyldihydropteridine diphosphokinase [Proteobacteria bacterium]|nr:2-amino-4-hydroxy-6-hydroxymethyldihydropteridine diphosphokinase [Pseudomonadota bacterium]